MPQTNFNRVKEEGEKLLDEKFNIETGVLLSRRLNERQLETVKSFLSTFADMLREGIVEDVKTELNKIPPYRKVNNHDRLVYEEGLADCKNILHDYLLITSSRVNCAMIEEIKNNLTQ